MAFDYKGNFYKPARDTRSTEIKRLLKGRFPSSTFRVRINKYSGGESINIETDLLKPYLTQDMRVWRAERDFNGCSDDDRAYYKAFKDRMEARDLAERAIKDVVGHFKKVDRDDQGDILLGGNTFLFIESLQTVSAAQANIEAYKRGADLRDIVGVQ